MTFFRTATLPPLALLFLCLSVTSCDVDPLQGDEEIQSTLDHFFAQSEFSAIQTVIDGEARLSTELNKTTNTQGFLCDCSQASVTANGDGTFTMVVDFGSGCTCLDGRIRRGKLMGVFNGKWNQAGASVTITSDGYTVTALTGATYEFDFTKTITLVDEDTYSVNVQNARLTSDEGVITWNSTRTVEWAAGKGDLDPSNNEFLISGTASGTATNGVDFTVTIDEPLRVVASCPHVVSGVLSLTPDGKAERLIDYGNGDCDSEVILTIAGFSRSVELP